MDFLQNTQRIEYEDYNTASPKYTILLALITNTVPLNIVGIQ